MGTCKNCGYEKECHEVIDMFNDNEDGYEQYYICPTRTYFEDSQKDGETQ